MAEPLSILHLEDDPLESERLETALAREGLAVAIWRVGSPPELLAALQRGGFQLILADAASTAFDWPAAFALAQAHNPLVSFIAIDARLDSDAGRAAWQRRLPLIRQAARLAQELDPRQTAHPEHWYWLAEASQAFSAAGPEPGPVLEAVARSAAMITGSLCAVSLLSADGQWLDLAALRHPNPATQAQLPSLSSWRMPATAGARGEALSTGQPALRSPITTSELRLGMPQALWGQLDQLKVTSLLAVPLRARGQNLGTLTLTRAESDHLLGPEDVALATSLADRAALAIENARLFQQATQAADRLAQLATVSTALSRALTPPEVARVIMNQGLSVLGAAAATLFTLSDDGQWLVQMSTIGYPRLITGAFQRFPISTDVPTAEAVRTGQSVWLASADEHRARYPQLSASIAAMGYQAVAALPLRYDERVIGALGISFPQAMDFTAETRLFVTTLAGHCAQALERARLFASEQQAGQAAQQEAQRAFHQTERVARLQAVTAALSQLLTPPQVVEVVSEHGRALFGASACSLYLLAADGDSLEMITAPAQALPESVAPVRRMTLSAPLPVAEVVRTGQPLWFESNAPLVERYPLLAPVRAATGQQALVVVPLLLETRVLGALVFSFAEPRPFDPQEQAYLLTLAQQAAQALDRARLLAEAQAMNTLLEARVAERTAQLRQLTRQLEQWRENERTRIAQDVHDELGGALTALKMEAVRLLRNYGDYVPERALHEAAGLLRQIDSTVGIVRRIASDLHPPGLDEFGLVPALEAHFSEFRERAGLAGALHTQVDDLPLTGEAAIACFRIVQEALTNVARHAHATRVDLSVSMTDSRAVLRIADDGQGLPPEVLSGAAPSGSAPHLGLAGMRERAQMFAWDLALESSPGHGTVVELTIPLDLKRTGN